MSVLKYFKTIPRSPSIERQAQSVIFFLQICNEVPGEKKEGGLSPPQRATGPCRPPQGRQDPVARWGGATGSLPPILNPGHHSLCHLSLKIQDKREG